MNQAALVSMLERYVVSENVKQSNGHLEEYFKTEIIQDGNFSVAKEVLLVKSHYPEFDCLIVELFRFSDDGKIKHKFKGGKVVLEGSGMEFTVLHRSATVTGMDRFLLENEAEFKTKKIGIFHADESIESVEGTPAAQLHKTFLQSLLEKEGDYFKCLHCDKPLGVADSTIVEIDDIDSKAAVGAIHKKCLRTIDRVIGQVGFSKELKTDFLKSFDYKEWARLILKGQICMNHLNNSFTEGERISVISWNSEEKHFRDYSYCIKFILADGSDVYGKEAGRIKRLNKLEAEMEKNEMLQTLLKSKKENDPFSFTSKSYIFSVKSRLAKLKNVDEDILEVENIEVVRYSKLLEKSVEQLNFYAPICLVRHQEEETILNFDGLIPLISNPLSFEKIFSTWKNIGFKLNPSELELKIIKSDIEFDSYMREFFASDMKPFIDPQFSESGQILSGFQVVHFQKMIAEKANVFKKVAEPAWKKDDRVFVVFPDPKIQTHPEGIILEDEFEGNNGELFVIFSPVENGKRRDDLSFSVPSKYLKRAP